MGTEIERKFLIDVDKLKASSTPLHIYKIEQAFIVTQPNATVRVRIMTSEEHTALVPHQKIKLGFKLGCGPVRDEFEFDIDLETAEAYISTYPSVRKTRYVFAIEGSERYWEVDEFHGKHEGLWLAEIELGSLDEAVDLPSWIADEVTYDAEYYNCNIAQTDK